jgi:hypothetical protein
MGGRETNTVLQKNYFAFKTEILVGYKCSVTNDLKVACMNIFRVFYSERLKFGHQRADLLMVRSGRLV